MTQMNLFPTSVRRLFADPFFAPLELPSFGNGTGDGPVAWTPPVDVRDSDTEVRIDMELPGVSREDISVRFHDGRLTIEGRRSHETNGNGEAESDVSLARPASGWTRRERFQGVYRRTFSVPDTVDVSAIKAETRDGVLTLTLPKLEKAHPRQIEVQVH